MNALPPADCTITAPPLHEVLEEERVVMTGHESRVAYQLSVFCQADFTAFEVLCPKHKCYIRTKNTLKHLNARVRKRI